MTSTESVVLLLHCWFSWYCWNRIHPAWWMFNESVQKI